MVDGVMLLVDASEGPLPQTRFVLRKALERRLPPIVVINKIDRPDARTQEVLNEIYDLFIDLDATEEQLDFPVLYTSATRRHVEPDQWRSRRGSAAPVRRDRGRCAAAAWRPRCAAADARREPRFERLPGRIAIGRVFNGTGERSANRWPCASATHVQETQSHEASVFEGLGRDRDRRRRRRRYRQPAGFEDINIGETIATASNGRMPIIAVDEPTSR